MNGQEDKSEPARYPNLDQAFSAWLDRIDDPSLDPEAEADWILEKVSPLIRPLLREQIRSVLDLAHQSFGDRARLTGRTLGGFEIGEYLGQGSTGSVWSARDLTGEPCAVKFIHSLFLASPGGAALISREVQAAQRVKHPNAVRIHNIIDEPDFFGLVTDLVGDGSTLADEIARKRESGEQTDARQMLERLLPALRAVAAMHDSGVIHLDIKPGNLLLDDEGTIHVTDLGLARISDQTGSTRPFQILGTPAYMSPEVARGDRKSAGPRSDVFSLGVTLFEALAMERPFRGTSHGVTDTILHQPPAPLHGPLRGLSHGQMRGIRSILQRCMEKAPADRYASAGELADAIENMLAGKAFEGSPLRRRVRMSYLRNKVAVRAWAGLTAVLTFLSALALTLAISRDRQTARISELLDVTTSAFDLGEAAPGLERDRMLIKVIEKLEQLTSNPLYGSETQRARALFAVARSIMSSSLDGEAVRRLLQKASELGSGLPLEEQVSLRLFMFEVDHLHWRWEDEVHHLDWILDNTDESLEGPLGLQRARAILERQDIMSYLNEPGHERHEEQARSAAEFVLQRAADPDIGRNPYLVLLALRTARLLGGVAIDTDFGDLPALVEDLERSAGYGHPWTIVARTELGRTYSRSGEREKALTVYEDNLERSRARLGDDHPTTHIQRIGAAQALQHLGRREEAAVQYRLGLEGLERAAGGPTSLTLRISIGYGALLVGMQRGKDALGIVEQIEGPILELYPRDSGGPRLVRRLAMQTAMILNDEQLFIEKARDQFDVYKGGAWKDRANLSVDSSAYLRGALWLEADLDIRTELIRMALEGCGLAKGEPWSSEDASLAESFAELEDHCMLALRADAQGLKIDGPGSPPDATSWWILARQARGEDDPRVIREFLEALDRAEPAPAPGFETWGLSFDVAVLRSRLDGAADVDLGLQSEVSPIRHRAEAYAARH